MIALEYKQGELHMIDQRKLPQVFEMFVCKTWKEVDFAIQDMVVRGAPAIGAAAAYGAALAAREYEQESKDVFLSKMEESLAALNESRPTAVNLMWAVKRMRNLLDRHQQENVEQLVERIEAEAHAVVAADQAINIAMGNHGNTIIPEKATILTHCNTGALATVGIGTALGVVRQAFRSGKNIFVYADETRPRLQGGRLTAWELMQEGIPANLIADSVAATLIRDGKIDVILVGADRIATNGDTANKIGTFMLSVLAKTYNVPFYVVAPTTTIDFDMVSGSEIVIEERSSEEVTHIDGHRTAPEGIGVYNPAFDVTPHENITGIITEKGIVRAPFNEQIPKLK
ncbi:S-methyl-5-thioribose-1-phosphate isomerase [Anoxynatronum buryatiense]|uniref:S-methyl-5-thioribose-1-phosphate isomerase n=1 Tax=Anoxynatronum buryatiense TaxID=489973 RepID=UPI0024B847B5|nr:S-methyl-5-thioribose-1-phosphate isomerase [Anoxynatronum buryatiense]